MSRFMRRRRAGNERLSDARRRAIARLCPCPGPEDGRSFMIFHALDAIDIILPSAASLSAILRSYRLILPRPATGR